MKTLAEQIGDTETSRQIIVRIKIPTHRALRIRVAEEDTSIQKWVEELIERELGIAAEKEGSIATKKAR
ncbi:MAG: hypothetical protein ACE15F_18740 [bacterium]